MKRFLSIMVFGIVAMGLVASAQAGRCTGFGVIEKPNYLYYSIGVDDAEPTHYISGELVDDAGESCSTRENDTIYVFLSTDSSGLDVALVECDHDAGKILCAHTGPIMIDGEEYAFDDESLKYRLAYWRPGDAWLDDQEFDLSDIDVNAEIAQGLLILSAVTTMPYKIAHGLDIGVNQSCMEKDVAERSGDRDCDFRLDGNDNCPDVANASQHNIDGDTLGDACDPDMDGDGKLNDADNCVRVPNPDQADTDEDGIGDACEHDRDGDGVDDNDDNCKSIPNWQQIDSDGDGIGDACDTDEAPDIGDDDDDDDDVPGGSINKGVGGIDPSGIIPLDEAGGGCSLTASAAPGFGSFACFLMGLAGLIVRRHTR